MTTVRYLFDSSKFGIEDKKINQSLLPRKEFINLGNFHGSGVNARSCLVLQSLNNGLSSVKSLSAECYRDIPYGFPVMIFPRSVNRRLRTRSISDLSSKNHNN